MPVSFTQPETQSLRASIKRFFREELAQDIGDLRMRLVLDCIPKEIALSPTTRA